MAGNNDDTRDNQRIRKILDNVSNNTPLVALQTTGYSLKHFLNKGISFFTNQNDPQDEVTLAINYANYKAIVKSTQNIELPGSNDSTLGSQSLASPQNETSRQNNTAGSSSISTTTIQPRQDSGNAHNDNEFKALKAHLDSKADANEAAKYLDELNQRARIQNVVKVYSNAQQSSWKLWFNVNFLAQYDALFRVRRLPWFTSSYDTETYRLVNQIIKLNKRYNPEHDGTYVPPSFTSTRQSADRKNVNGAPDCTPSSTSNGDGEGYEPIYDIKSVKAQYYRLQIQNTIQFLQNQTGKKAKTYYYNGVEGARLTAANKVHQTLNYTRLKLRQLTRSINFMDSLKDKARWLYFPLKFITLLSSPLVGKSLSLIGYLGRLSKIISYDLVYRSVKGAVTSFIPNYFETQTLDDTLYKLLSEAGDILNLKNNVPETLSNKLNALENTKSNLETLTNNQEIDEQEIDEQQFAASFNQYKQQLAIQLKDAKARIAAYYQLEGLSPQSQCSELIESEYDDINWQQNDYARNDNLQHVKGGKDLRRAFGYMYHHSKVAGVLHAENGKIERQRIDPDLFEALHLVQKTIKDINDTEGNHNSPQALNETKQLCTRLIKDANQGDLVDFYYRYLELIDHLSFDLLNGYNSDGTFNQAQAQAHKQELDRFGNIGNIIADKYGFEKLYFETRHINKHIFQDGYNKQVEKANKAAGINPYVYVRSPDNAQKDNNQYRIVTDEIVHNDQSASKAPFGTLNRLVSRFQNAIDNAETIEQSPSQSYQDNDVAHFTKCYLQVTDNILNKKLENFRHGPINRKDLFEGDRLISYEGFVDKLKKKLHDPKQLTDLGEELNEIYRLAKNYDDINSQKTNIEQDQDKNLSSTIRNFIDLNHRFNDLLKTDNVNKLLSDKNKELELINNEINRVITEMVACVVGFGEGNIAAYMCFQYLTDRTRDIIALTYSATTSVGGTRSNYHLMKNGGFEVFKFLFQDKAHTYDQNTGELRSRRIRLFSSASIIFVVIGGITMGTLSFQANKNFLGALFKSASALPFFVPLPPLLSIIIPIAVMSGLVVKTLYFKGYAQLIQEIGDMLSSLKEHLANRFFISKAFGIPRAHLTTGQIMAFYGKNVTKFVLSITITTLCVLIGLLGAYGYSFIFRGTFDSFLENTLNLADNFSWAFTLVFANITAYCGHGVFFQHGNLNMFAEMTAKEKFVNFTFYSGLAIALAVLTPALMAFDLVLWPVITLAVEKVLDLWDETRPNSESDNQLSIINPEQLDDKEITELSNQYNQYHKLGQGKRQLFLSCGTLFNSIGQGFGVYLDDSVSDFSNSLLSVLVFAVAFGSYNQNIGSVFGLQESSTLAERCHNIAKAFSKRMTNNNVENQSAEQTSESSNPVTYQQDSTNQIQLTAEDQADQTRHDHDERSVKPSGKYGLFDSPHEEKLKWLHLEEKDMLAATPC